MMLASKTANIWVIDNWYRDFDAVRRIALNSRFETTGPKAHYQGRNSIDFHLFSEDFEKVRNKIGHCHVSVTARKGYKPASTGRFRCAYGRHVERDGGIHYDYRDAYAGVVYMNTPEQCKGRIGTQFWRHKKTGLRKSDRVDMGIRENFELVRSVMMKSNRCVLFDADQFHSIHHNFGNSVETARIVHLFWMFKGHSKAGINCC